MHRQARQKVRSRRTQRANMAAMLIALSFVSACGDQSASNNATPRESLLAARVVAATEVPNLYHCLDDIGESLRKSPGRAQVSLTCATGTYRGQTAAGRPCELHIDGENSDFKFILESETVWIKFEQVAHSADGAALHNLEDASAPAQPGIQLTRFTGAPVPVTEALILRFQGALPAMPQMIYQRSADGPPTAVLCRFGT